MAASRVIPVGTAENLAVGHTPITKNVLAALTVAECSNVLISVTASVRMVLPLSQPGLACTIYAQGAVIVTIDQDGGDPTPFVFDNTLIDPDHVLQSEGVGDEYALVQGIDGGWRVTSYGGNWSIVLGED